MARSTFLPNQIKNKGGAGGRKAFDHSLGSAMQVARIFTYNGVVQTPGSAFSLTGVSDPMVKLLWEHGYLDLT